MKVFEPCLLSYLDPIVSNSIDPYQFAYRSKRSVEDAILHVMNNVYKHLEKPGSSVRLMFYDFSSAFNTIQPHLLCDKLINCDLLPSTILWILDYLSSRPQVVKLSPTVCSNSITTNTGAPQGTVLSPFLFSIYTSDCRPSHDSCFVDKYADDTVLTGLITNDFDNEYVHEITSFVNWCKMNHLVLNIDKTKEVVIDFRKTNRYWRSPINPAQDTATIETMITKENQLLVGDFNAHSQTWGNNKRDKAGQILEEKSIEIVFNIINTGEPTRQRCYSRNNRNQTR